MSDPAATALTMPLAVTLFVEGASTGAEGGEGGAAGATGAGDGTRAGDATAVVVEDEPRVASSNALISSSRTVHDKKKG